MLDSYFCITPKFTLGPDDAKRRQGRREYVSHHLHPETTKPLANATFNNAFLKTKNGLALDVSVNAMVMGRFCKTYL